MTQASATPPSAPASAAAPFTPETFAAIALRRTRYVLAVCVSAFLFYTLGWAVAAPPPEASGVSLLAWSTSSGLYASLALTGILILATIICTWLIHPDAPHMGLFCAMLGMSASSIRGGTVHMLVRIATAGGRYPEVSRLLAMECVDWALPGADRRDANAAFASAFFRNTRWITRSGPDLEAERSRLCIPPAGRWAFRLTVSRPCAGRSMRRRVATPLAMVYSGIVAVVLLFMLLQSPTKGQVFFACFTAFFLSTLNSYLAFSRVPFAAFILTVPLVAAAGYLYGMNALPEYPGHPGFFMARALPIDYVAAGIPGAILGYYGGFRWSLHSPAQAD